MGRTQPIIKYACPDCSYNAVFQSSPIWMTRVLLSCGLNQKRLAPANCKIIGFFHTKIQNSHPEFFRLFQNKCSALGAWKQALAAETWPSTLVSQSDACLARGRRGERSLIRNQGQTWRDLETGNKSKHHMKRFSLWFSECSTNSTTPWPRILQVRIFSCRYVSVSHATTRTNIPKTGPR